MEQKARGSSPEIKPEWITLADNRPDLLDEYRKFLYKLQRKFQSAQSEAYVTWCILQQQ